MLCTHQKLSCLQYCQTSTNRMSKGLYMWLAEKKVKLIAFNVVSNSYSYFIARFIVFVLKFWMMCSSFVHVWWISDNLRAVWHQCAFLFQKLAFFFIYSAFQSIHLFMRINRSQRIEPIRVLHLNKYWMKHRKIPFKMNAWSLYSSIKLSICPFCIWHIEYTRSFPIELAFGVA